MSSRKTAKEEHGKQDLYQVLSVSRTASSEEIKSAYKKAALRYHPDKNPGEEAAQHFQAISAAYSVLGDTNKRAKYDARGFAGLEPSELDTEIDVSSLGLFSTVAAAMFSKLGVPIKTSIPATVLENTYEGKFQAANLDFGQAKPDKVEKGQAAYYEVLVSQEHIDGGFIIGAHSPVGSKIKLLLFEETGPQRWELQMQEDSAHVQKGASLAGLYFLTNKTYKIGPRPVMEAASNPEALLFLRLDSMVPRERVTLKPGKLLIAVVNDNWFKRASYTISAVLPIEHSQSIAAIADVEQLESKLLDKQSSLRAFEREYRQAQEQWLAVCEKFERHSSEIDAVLKERDEAYLKLLLGPGTSDRSVVAGPVFVPPWASKGSRPNISTK